MEPESNSDREGKKDQLPHSKTAKATKKKAKGKRPIESETKLEAPDEDTSSSSTSTEKPRKCKDAMDYYTLQTKGIAIGSKKPGVSAGKSKRKATTTADGDKRRKKARGGIKKTVTMVSGLNDLAMSFESDSEQSNADVVKRELKGKRIKQEEEDLLNGLDADSDEACKRINNRCNEDNRNDDDDEAGGGGGAGTGSGGGQVDLSSHGLLVEGK